MADVPPEPLPRRDDRGHRWRTRYARLPVGLRASVIMVFPTAAIGLSFGLTAAHTFGVPASIVMSCIVWAGTAQFAALNAVAGGSGPPLAIVVGLLAHMRYVPMSFGVAPSIGADVPRWKRALIGASLADASFAIGHEGGGRFDLDKILWAAPLQWVGWVGGTVVGALCASLISDPGRYGIDAIFPVFYVSILLPELRRSGARRARLVALLAAGFALVTTPILPAGVPVLAGACAALAGIRR